MTLMEEAESLILHQFARSPKLKGLIRSLVAPFQEILSHIEALHHGSYTDIDQASGPQLDVLGEIVGQPRRGMKNDDYRAWIKVGIRLNTGKGTPENVLSILAILYDSKPSLLLREYPPNKVVFTFFALPKAPIKALFDIIHRSAPVTTSCHFVRAESDPAFRFDTSSFSQSHFAEFFKEDFI